MSVSLNIHPEGGGVGSLRFEVEGLPSYGNVNCVNLRFVSGERLHIVEHTINAFRLNQTDADMLALCGMLDADRREKAVEMLWGLLDEQKGTAA